jgi:ribonuclease HII
VPSFDLEQKLAPRVVVGVDEAGCGPWAGPVVAAAVIIDASLWGDALWQHINDSKKLNAVQRQRLAEAIRTLDPTLVQWGIGEASVAEIDQLNIRQAAFLAMNRALAQVTRAPDIALVDGKFAPQLGCPVQMVIKGDGLSCSIAAASILAKVHRDTIMATLAQEYPDYGWERNAGYGTALHQQALKAHGITPHHRRSFAPIRNYV